jgi:hypothetical protein
MPCRIGSASAGRPAPRQRLLVDLQEADLVHLLMGQEGRVARVVLDPHLAQHLADDNLDVLVVGPHAWRRYTCWISSSRYLRSASSPCTSRMSCGMTGPSVRALARIDPVAGLHVEVLAGRDGVLAVLAHRRITRTLRMPLVDPPSSTMPSMWLMTAGSFGWRASNSSATRGRPPVMSLVFENWRGVFGQQVAREHLVAVVHEHVRLPGHRGIRQHLVSARPGW